LYCPTIQWKNYYVNQLSTVICLLIILLIVGVLIDNKSFVCVDLSFFSKIYDQLYNEGLVLLICWHCDTFIIVLYQVGDIHLSLNKPK